MNASNKQPIRKGKQSPAQRRQHRLEKELRRLKAARTQHVRKLKSLYKREEVLLGLHKVWGEDENFLIANQATMRKIARGWLLPEDGLIVEISRSIV
jgi:hypothetical protein